MAVATASVTLSEPRVFNRWLILSASVISMVAVANFQYGWTLFVPPLQAHLGQEQALIQVTFTIFVLLETWLVPFEGWLVDRFGPRLLVMLGGAAAGLTAAGFGAGSALTVSPIANMINTAGYQAAFIEWGIIQGAVVVVAAMFLKAPPAGWMP